MAKEMKRVLRENTTTLTPKQAKFLSEKLRCSSQKEPGFVKLYFDCLGVYIKNDGLSASLNDMLLEVLHRASYMHKTGKSYTLAHTTKGANLKRLTKYAPLRAGHYDMG